MSKRTFISHISEEAIVAELLKTVLVRDFLGLMDVFVSSDTESIAAGEEWLRSVEKALRESVAMIVVCSPESIRRPWINFEAGAAWMRNIPLIPVCHLGLVPRDLPMPLSLRQGIELREAEGLKILYSKMAQLLSVQVPAPDFGALSKRLGEKQNKVEPQVDGLRQVEAARGVRGRLAEALNNPRFRWRSLERVAAESALSEEQVADLLRSEPDVRFSKARSGRVIVGLRSRVG